ncbi:MAG: aldehyde dehydrogenase [Flavobacteriaceae bacterium]
MVESKNISERVQLQKNFFQTGKTKNVSYRIDILKKLLKAVKKREKTICDALYKDFKKPPFETIVTETTLIEKEIKFTLKNLKNWSRTKSVKSTLFNFPSKDFIYFEPYGTVLIIAPWNYPFQLAISPLIGAIAAGNTAIVKPSELTPQIASVIDIIIKEVFPPEYVKVFQGGVETAQNLLKEKWDYVFFTGSVKVGKIVAKSIAENLTPHTLELGGKNPCIIDESAKVNTAVKRIVSGKFINAGQTCIAPDYLLVHEKIEKKFLNSLQKEIERAYGKNPKYSKDYPRIINESNFNRLVSLIPEDKVIIGGGSDMDDLFIEPTVLLNPSLHSEVMKDEIFGPILPVLIYQTEKDIDLVLHKYPNPLALYVFSSKKSFSEKMIKKYAFGGGTINDTLVHIVNPRLPFGGIGNSGMGAYHGKHSFETFSHKKAITKRATWLDIPLRYAPYNNKAKWIKRLSKFF